LHVGQAASRLEEVVWRQFWQTGQLLPRRNNDDWLAGNGLDWRPAEARIAKLLS
jgi:hypothetical protein